MKFLNRIVFYFFVVTVLGYNSHITGQVVINEVMINPATNATSAEFQSLVHCGQSQWGAEYIELYNSDDCNSIDISCYVLGFQSDGFGNSDIGSFRFPEGTVIPPLGFISIGGPLSNSTINLFDFCGTPNLNTADTRWYLQNSIGYVMLWNPQGETEDAVWWRSSNAGWGTNSDLQVAPNNNIAQGTSGCANITSLQAPSSLAANSPLVSYAGAGASIGTVIHRTVDGGTDWATNATPSLNACNSVCNELNPDCDPVPECSVPFSINLSSTPNENCDPSSGCTGSASVEIVSNFDGVVYTYEWDDENSQDTPEATGLCAGEYCVTVTDASGLCIETACITVVNDFFDVSADVTQPTCGDSNGSILINAVPQDDYTYSWSHDSELTTNEAQNLGNGTYTITISNNGCEIQIEEELFSEGISDVSVNLSETTCGFDNGSISVENVTGGSPTFSYSLNPGASQASNTFEDLSPGAYSVTVTDNEGCIFIVDNLSVDDSEGISDAEINTIAPDCGAENGSLTVDNIIGGNEPYTYSINGSASSSNMFSGLGEGNHLILLSDADGCTYETTISFSGSSFDDNIEPPNVITANGDNVNDIWFIEASCLADFKGVIVNRWGNEIKQLSLENSSWDGRTSNGEKVTEGVYFYKAILTFQTGEEKNIHGYIHVVL